MLGIKSVVVLNYGSSEIVLGINSVVVPNYGSSDILDVNSVVVPNYGSSDIMLGINSAVVPNYGSSDIKLLQTPVKHLPTPINTVRPRSLSYSDNGSSQTRVY